MFNTLQVLQGIPNSDNSDVSTFKDSIILLAQNELRCLEAIKKFEWDRQASPIRGTISDKFYMNTGVHALFLILTDLYQTNLVE